MHAPWEKKLYMHETLHILALVLILVNVADI